MVESGVQKLTDQMEDLERQPSEEKINKVPHRRVSPAKLFGDAGSIKPFEGSPTSLVPKIFVEGKPGEKKFFRANKAQLRFLNAWEKTQGDLAESLEESGLELKQLRAFLRRKDFRMIMQDRTEKLAIQMGLTSSAWMKMGWEVLQEQRKPSREWVDVWKEIGARVKPKEVKRVETGEGGGVTINISGDAIVEAKKRQKVIEAKVVEEAEEER